VYFHVGVAPGSTSLMFLAVTAPAPATGHAEVGSDPIHPAEINRRDVIWPP